MEEIPSFRALRGETVTGANAVDERFESLDGRLFEASVTAAPVCDAAGSIVGAVAVAREVTAQRQLERQVREQAAQLEAIFEAIADGIGVFDLQGRFLRANRALHELEGLEADGAYITLSLAQRAQRLSFFDEQRHRLAADQWPHWRALQGETFAGASAVEVLLQTLDERTVWVSITGAPVRTADRQITGGVLILRDVTARRALERQVAEQAAATERTRLAHELHDTVTQEIYSAGLLADSISRNWPQHRADAEAALAQLPGLIRGALAGLRVLLLELRPTTLDDLPLAALLQQLAEAMSSRAQVPIAVHLRLSERSDRGSADTEGKPAPDSTDAAPVDAAEPVLPPAVKEVFYRVAQEALMNAAKYARAHTISVQLRTRTRGQSAGKGKGRGNGTGRSNTGTEIEGTSTTLELAIVDDGQGFDPRAIPAGHFGLAIMRERTHAVGATLRVRSLPGQGTQIVTAWRSGRGTGRTPQATRQAVALHQKAAPHV
jgi:PAS domain S-box-containing protein